MNPHQIIATENQEIIDETLYLIEEEEKLTEFLELFYPESLQLRRALQWFDFFNRHFYKRNSNYQLLICSYIDYFHENDVILSQTQHEYQLSHAFILELFTVKQPKYLVDEDAAIQLICTALFYGIFPGIFRSFVKKEISKLPQHILEDDLVNLLKNLVVKYEYPETIFYHLEMLSAKELKIIAEGITGKNNCKHPDLPTPLTKNEFMKLMSLSEKTRFEDSFLLKASIYVKLIDKNESTNPILITFLNSSYSFIYEPKIFEKNFSFWKMAYRLILQILEIRNNHYIISDIIDFLEYKLDEGNFTLKGKTPQSLLRALGLWHQYNIHGLIDKKYSDSKWDGLPMSDLTFNYKNQQYKCIQLKEAAEIKTEGAELNHCVYTYIPQILKGNISIWSLQVKVENIFMKYITLEISKTKTIRQARKYNNASLDAAEIKLLAFCANKLKCNIEL